MWRLHLKYQGQKKNFFNFQNLFISCRILSLGKLFDWKKLFQNIWYLSFCEKKKLLRQIFLSRMVFFAEWYKFFSLYWWAGTLFLCPSPTWGEGGGEGRGRDGRGVAEGYAPCLGVGHCRKVVFEGLSRGVRGDALACRGHPYMFIITVYISNYNLYMTKFRTDTPILNIPLEVLLFTIHSHSLN